MSVRCVQAEEAKQIRSTTVLRGGLVHGVVQRHVGGAVRRVVRDVTTPAIVRCEVEHRIDVLRDLLGEQEPLKFPLDELDFAFDGFEVDEVSTREFVCNPCVGFLGDEVLDQMTPDERCTPRHEHALAVPLTHSFSPPSATVARLVPSSSAAAYSYTSWSLCSIGMLCSHPISAFIFVMSQA